MGFDINRCISNRIDDEFLCQICCGIIQNPVQINACGHVFCKQCIGKWIENKTKCPVDNNDMTDNSLTQISDEFWSKYSQIVITCEFIKNGCNEFVTIGEYVSHHHRCVYNTEKFRECECGEHVDINDSTHSCILSLKSKIADLTSNEIKLQLFIRELQTKLNEKIEENLTLKKFVSHSHNYLEASFELIDLVEALKELRVIKSMRVENTFLSVNREVFCPQNPYSNHKVNMGFGADFNSPVIDATILELLKNHLVEGAKVLDIGSGSGYLSTCMALMCGKIGKVIGIDIVRELIEISTNCVNKIHADLIDDKRLEFIVSDGRYGYASEAPFDVINVGASVTKIPQCLLSQLKCGGRMIVALGIDFGLQSLETIDKLSNGTVVRNIHLKVNLKPLRNNP